MAEKNILIKRPKFEHAVFTIIGTAPLVVHRFSLKVKNELKQKQETGKAASSKKTREPQSTEDTYNAARYISAEGWDGFNASAMRAAMINACRLIGFKMTLAKMSIFVEQDGWDKLEPQVPLIRIIGNPIKQEDVARVEGGAPYVTARPAYHNWKANVRIRWDADQFTIEDVTNLLSRVGMQVGLCEGRPFSKEGVGMGWGTFRIGEKNEKD